MKAKNVIEAIFMAYACDYEEMENSFRVPRYMGLSGDTLEEFESHLYDYAELDFVREEDGSTTLFVNLSDGEEEVSAPFWEGYMGY